MKAEDLRRLMLPPGPILSVTLIGLVLLSSVLYYKAVSVQRRMEPVMAFIRPRMEFSGFLENIINREFPEKYEDLIIVSPDAVYASNSLVYTKQGAPEPDALDRLSRLAEEILMNPATRRHINLIIVTVRYPIGQTADETAKNRHIASKRAEGIMDEIIGRSPALGTHLRPYLASAAVGAIPKSPRLEWLELGILHTDQLHMDMLNML